MNKRVKIFTHFLFLSIILSALSCGRNENGRSDASDLINILVNKPENRSLIKISDIVDKVEIIPLEFNDSCIIGKIKKLEIFDNKIYILDGQNRRHLYVFNMQGKFLRTIGHLGKGPKEHQDLTDFDIDREKDVVIILDNASEKLIEYDQQGNFIKTVHVTAPADNFAVSNNLIYMYRASPQIYTKYDLNIYNFDGKHVRGYFKSMANDVGRYSPDIFSNYQGRGQKLFFHSWLNDTIYTLEKEKVFASYYIDFGEHAVTKSDKEVIYRNREKTMKILNEKKYASNIGNILMAKHIICFSYVYGNIKYKGFYNTNTKNFKNSYDITDDLSYLYFCEPIAEDNGRLIGVYTLEGVDHNISYIKENIKLSKEPINKKRALETLNLLEKVNQNILDSNPLIVLYDVK